MAEVTTAIDLCDRQVWSVDALTHDVLAEHDAPNLVVVRELSPMQLLGVQDLERLDLVLAVLADFFDRVARDERLAGRHFRRRAPSWCSHRVESPVRIRLASTVVSLASSGPGSRGLLSRPEAIRDPRQARDDGVRLLRFAHRRRDKVGRGGMALREVVEVVPDAGRVRLERGQEREDKGREGVDRCG